jgi:hypothetical protein
MKKNIVIASVLLWANIYSVYAAALDPNTVLQKVVTEIFNPIYKAAVAAAFIYFLYGVVKYLHDMRNPQDKNTGKQHLLWGTIGLFIIFSVGGILGIFSSMFGALGVS